MGLNRRKIKIHSPREVIAEETKMNSLTPRQFRGKYQEMFDQKNSPKSLENVLVAMYGVGGIDHVFKT